MKRITDSLIGDGAGLPITHIKYFLSPGGKNLPPNNVGEMEDWHLATSLSFRARVFTNRLVTRNLFRSPDRSLVSFPRVRSGIPERISHQSFDLAHLHWLGDSTMSIREVGSLRIPLVWTLHDMWPIGGVQHYTLSDRHHVGYFKRNRDAGEVGADLNRKAWNSKIASWKRPIFFVSPSEWLAKETRNSVIGSKGQVFHIPNPIDTSFWHRVDDDSFRDQHKIENGVKVIAFGSAGGKKNKLKGSEMLSSLSAHLSSRLKELESSTRVRVLIFGEAGEDQFFDNVHLSFLGNLDDEELRSLYSAADVVLVPSVIDNYPLVATEAISCGTPIVAFGGYGPAEIVKQTGAGLISTRNNLPQAASEIIELLESPAALQRMAESGIEYARARWNPVGIRDQYLEVFQEAMLLGKESQSQ